MLSFLSSGREGGPLAEVASADQFWQWLPRDEPFVAQKAISEALRELCTSTHPTRDQFRILLAIDQRLSQLVDTLLQNYTDEHVPSPSMELASWESCLALSQSFGQAYVYAAGHIRHAAPSKSLREFAPAVLMRLFQHRQVEFLLRPFLTERPDADCWTEVHGAYQYAREMGLLHHHAVVARIHDERRAVSTLEREYIHLLLLELMNRGQVTPYDAFWVNRSLSRWSALLKVEVNERAKSDDRPGDYLFIDREEGLVRKFKRKQGSPYYIDSAPVLAQINAEITALHNRADPAVSSALRDRRIKLLGKLTSVYAPRPAPTNRRGQRTPGTSTFHAVVGLRHVMSMLRYERDRKAAMSVGERQAVKRLSATRAAPSERTPDAARAAVPTNNMLKAELGAPHQVWHLKDRSESGCRFRAQSAESARIAPGTLVAIREGEDAPWMLAVVRRRRTRIGDRLDIGVEFLGRNPHGVALSVEDADDNPPVKSARFNAIYLPESDQDPALPFKTLVLATREFKVGRRLMLESARATFTIRLKEPIEEQGEFAWLPYEVIDRRINPRDAESSAETGAATAPRLASTRADGVNSDAVTALVTGETRSRVLGARNP